MGDNDRIGVFNGPRKQMEEWWRRPRVLMGGTDALREAGEEFTPKTARERKNDPDLYRERLDSSVLYNVYEETVQRIASLAFEKPPVITGTLPEGVARIEDDADRCGVSLSVFASIIHQDAVDRGMGLFLVDNVPTYVDEPVLDASGDPVLDGEGRPRVNRRVMNRAEAEQADARPYFSRIDPDNLIGFQVQSRSGRDVCTELRVRETAFVPSPDGVGEREVERVRLYTTETVELWEKSDKGYVMIEEPREHGFPGDEIPIVAHYTRRCGYLFAKPPLLKLAHLNIKHWNQQSVLDSSLRHNLSPVLFGSGMPADNVDEPPVVGEGAVLMSTDERARLGYVEISGASLEIGRKEIEKTEMRMQAGATEPLVAGSATATGEVRAEMKEQSEAQRWIESCEWALYQGLKLAAKWLGKTLPEDVNITLHRASSLLQAANPQRTVALQSDAQAGRITLPTYLKERKRSGDFADDFDPEAEAAAVEMEAERRQQRQMETLAASIKAERERGDPNAPPTPPGQPERRTAEV